MYAFPFQSCSRATAWEDGISTTSSLSGAEENTIRAVCEQMKVDVEIIVVVILLLVGYNLFKF